MEQKLQIANATGTIGCYPLSELNPNTVLNIADGHVLSDLQLTDDTLTFTLNGDRLKLNRHWQVLATDPFVFYFGTENKDEESQESCFEDLYKRMVANAKTGDFWMNIPLAREALHLMKDVAPEEDRDDMLQLCEWVVTKKLLLDYETPRLVLSFMAFWSVTSHDFQKWAKAMQRLRRMIDPNTPEPEKMELMMVGRTLKSDPIQLTEAWEENIYEVEKELDKKYKDESPFMGFCYEYWSAKRAALARRGIHWKSPAIMNPHVRFD